MSGDVRLRSFHPLPAGLYRDPRYQQLNLVAARVLVDAHMMADDSETDGIVTRRQLSALGAFAGLLDGALEPVQELIAAGLLTSLPDGRYLLADFRGVSHERREELRAGARDRQERARLKRQRRYQMSQRDSQRDSQRESHPLEAEAEAEIEIEGEIPPTPVAAQRPTTPPGGDSTPSPLQPPRHPHLALTHDLGMSPRTVEKPSGLRRTSSSSPRSPSIQV